MRSYRLILSLNILSLSLALVIAFLAGRVQERCRIAEQRADRLALENVELMRERDQRECVETINKIYGEKKQ